MASKILIALLVCAVPALVGAQEVYTWKDSKGRTHFADRAPLDADAHTLRGAQPLTTRNASSEAPADASAPAATKKTGPKTWEDRDREFKQRQAEKAEAEAKAQKEKAQKAEKERYCTELRRNLAMLERGGRVSKANDKGESIPMSDTQIQSEIQRNRSLLSKECN